MSGFLAQVLVSKLLQYQKVLTLKKCEPMLSPSQRGHITLFQGLQVLKIEKLNLVFNIRYPWHQCQKTLTQDNRSSHLG